MLLKHVNERVILECVFIFIVFCRRFHSKNYPTRAFSGYEMIKANSALRVGYLSNPRSWNNCQLFCLYLRKPLLSKFITQKPLSILTRVIILFLISIYTLHTAGAREI